MYLDFVEWENSHVSGLRLLPWKPQLSILQCLKGPTEREKAKPPTLVPWSCTELNRGIRICELSCKGFNYERHARMLGGEGNVLSLGRVHGWITQDTHSQVCSNGNSYHVQIVNILHLKNVPSSQAKAWCLWRISLGLIRHSLTSRIHRNLLFPYINAWTACGFNMKSLTISNILGNILYVCLYMCACERVCVCRLGCPSIL